jgi:hypothetical protein
MQPKAMITILRPNDRYDNVLALQQAYPAVRMMVRAPAFATRQPPTIVRTASLYRLNGIGNAGNMRAFTFVVISPSKNDPWNVKTGRSTYAS